MYDLQPNDSSSLAILESQKARLEEKIRVLTVVGEALTKAVQQAEQYGKEVSTWIQNGSEEDPKYWRTILKHIRSLDKNNDEVLEAISTATNALQDEESLEWVQEATHQNVWMRCTCVWSQLVRHVIVTWIRFPTTVGQEEP